MLRLLPQEIIVLDQIIKSENMAVVVVAALAVIETDFPVDEILDQEIVAMVMGEEEIEIMIVAMVMGEEEIEIMIVAMVMAEEEIEIMIVAMVMIITIMDIIQD